METAQVINVLDRHTDTLIDRFIVAMMAEGMNADEVTKVLRRVRTDATWSASVASYMIS